MLVAVELSPNPQTSIPMPNKRQAVHKGRGRGYTSGSDMTGAQLPRGVGAHVTRGRGYRGGDTQGTPPRIRNKNSA